MSNQTADGAITPIVVSPSQFWEGNDGPWSTFAIHIGNDPQPARVLVSTVVGETWVISANRTQGGCLEAEEEDYRKCRSQRGLLFNTNSSTTWQDRGIWQLGAETNLPDYKSDYNVGNYGLDSLGFGISSQDGITLDNRVIAALATEEYYLGHLGINPWPTNFSSFEDPQTSLISALKEQRRIPSLSFGYSAGNTYRLKKVFGSLTLGGYDQSKFVPNEVSFNISEDISRDLLVAVQSITYNDAKTTDKRLLPNGILSFVDSTVPHIWLPKEACTAFEEAFNLEYNSTMNRYLVNDTLHNQLQQISARVSFLLGNDLTGGATVNITLPYQAFDLELAPPIVNTTTKYFPLRQAENETQYTLGRAFLQESYLIVNYENSNFSISQSRFQQDVSEQVIPILPKITETPQVKQSQSSSTPSTGTISGIVVGIVVLLCLMVGATVFLTRRRRRRRSEEEKRKFGETFDPMNKPEMDGHSKLPPGELFTEGKLGSEVEGKSWNEMEAADSNGYDADKLRAEMEGTRGGAEMEGTKGGVEMHAGEIAAPVEMWAGSQGLYEPLSAGHANDRRPSPTSRMPSSSGSERPLPASRSDQRSSGRLHFGQRQRSSRSVPPGGKSPVSSNMVDTVSGPHSGAKAWTLAQVAGIEHAEVTILHVDWKATLGSQAVLISLSPRLQRKVKVGDDSVIMGAAYSSRCRHPAQIATAVEGGLSTKAVLIDGALAPERRITRHLRGH